MALILWAGFTVIALLIGYRWRTNQLLKRRAQIIDGFQFPKGIYNKIAKKYSHLNEEQILLVAAGLKDYFHLCNLAGKQMVSMPSQVVDDLWHEFILFTQTYQLLCKKAFGRFLHHTPAEAMSSPVIAQEGIKRAWRLACAHENIDPKTPHQLPRLFALDQLLAIPEGFTYALNCHTHTSRKDHTDGPVYCASHIGCATSCGGGCGGSSDGGSGCGGGD